MGQKGKGGSWHDAGSKERSMGLRALAQNNRLSLGQELA